MHPKYFNFVHHDRCLAPIARLNCLGELPPNVTLQYEPAYDRRTDGRTDLL